MAFIKRESAQDGVTVLLSDSVVRELRRLTIDGFTALPRRGIEIGGVLLGSAGPAEVRVEAFEEVACEHRYGPSYALSSSDQASLHELIASWPSAKPPVIGFFRSFTSREPAIEDADEAFVREHFPSGWFVYLLLQPLSVENCVASFRLFRDGRLLTDTEAATWPFAVTQPSPEAQPPVAPQPAKQEKPHTLPPPIAPPRDPAEPPARAIVPRGRWWIAALVWLVSGAAGAFFGQMIGEMHNPSRASRWVDLHLDARPVDGLLELRWDAKPQQLAPTRGRVEVTDGESRRDIELGPEQLRSGKFTYAPSNQDVRLRLSLYAKELAIAGDTVRVKAVALPAKLPAHENTVAAAPTPPPQAAPPVASATHVAVAPAEVREVQPRIPEGIRSRIASPVIIPVEVEVSARGDVTRAVAARSPSDDGVRRYLAEEAQSAARKWRFRPARTAAGENVAASKTLRFVFTP